MLRRFGDEAGVLDVADDLDLVHAVARAGRADDVLFDHHAAHVVGAVGEAELPDLAALRDPRRLQVVEVVEHDARDRERAQVVDAGRLAAAELGVLRLIAPGDERGEAARLVLQLAQPEQVLEPLLDRLDGAVHHRRRRAQPGAVRVAHHVEPLVGGRLAVAVEQLAHAIDEDLGAAAGNAVEARRDQPLDDLRAPAAATAARGESLRAATARAAGTPGSAPSRRGTDPRTTRAAGRDCGRPAAAAGRRRARSSRRSSGRSPRTRGRSLRPSRPAGRTRRSCSARRRRSCS